MVASRPSDRNEYMASSGLHNLYVASALYCTFRVIDEISILQHELGVHS